MSETDDEGDQPDSVQTEKISSPQPRNNDEADRAAAAVQVSEGVSFLSSRLPDQEKLDSILEEQAELQKQDRALLTVDVSGGSQYFSEPEMTPPTTSPMGSRPATPVLSDSELEVGQRTATAGSANVKRDEQQSWEWGQLPTSSTSAVRKEVKDTGPEAPTSSEAQKKDERPEIEPSSWTSFFWRGRKKSSDVQVSSPYCIIPEHSLGLCNFLLLITFPYQGLFVHIGRLLKILQLLLI